MSSDRLTRDGTFSFAVIESVSDTLASSCATRASRCRNCDSKAGFVTTAASSAKVMRHPVGGGRESCLDVRHGPRCRVPGLQRRWAARPSTYPWRPLDATRGPSTVFGWSLHSTRTTPGSALAASIPLTAATAQFSYTKEAYRRSAGAGLEVGRSDSKQVRRHRPGEVDTGDELHHFPDYDRRQIASASR